MLEELFHVDKYVNSILSSWPFTKIYGEVGVILFPYYFILFPFLVVIESDDVSWLAIQRVISQPAMFDWGGVSQDHFQNALGFHLTCIIVYNNIDNIYI